MGVSKVNGGSSYPNQGDRNREGRLASEGTNVTLGAKSKPPKYGASVAKSKKYSNPSVPDYLS